MKRPGKYGGVEASAVKGCSSHRVVKGEEARVVHYYRVGQGNAVRAERGV